MGADNFFCIKSIETIRSESWYDFVLYNPKSKVYLWGYNIYTLHIYSTPINIEHFIKTHNNGIDNNQELKDLFSEMATNWFQIKDKRTFEDFFNIKLTDVLETFI